MTSDKFSGFLTPPACQHFGPIYSTKITQPPLLHQNLGIPLPSLSADVICEWPQRVEVKLTYCFHQGKKVSHSKLGCDSSQSRPGGAREALVACSNIVLSSTRIAH